jgi:endonuclease/exonuclease/phosphatase family metal-dependent hydrolase
MKFHLPSICLLLLLALTVCAQPHEAGERPTEFTVVTYNVENLFDVDGVALFDDYRLDDPDDPFGYSRIKFLTKLESIAAVLKTIGEGAGPEVILFQELEADITPGTSLEDLDAFLERYAHTTVAAMLTREWSANYAGFPAELWLAKMLSDHGMAGYRVATTPSKGLDSGIAHTNAVFSRFPIREVRRFPLEQARDLIEAELDIDGPPFIVYVNHWKSGASNPEREPIRVENAKVLRALIDARLQADPSADILVAGDLNAHYNHAILFPEIQTGIKDVLGSSGAEDFSQSDLYNLWFELPPEARYSEVWRGRRGSLMHMLVTPGLYDGEGISYIDGSFNKLVLPGLNADAIGRPLKWHFTGETGGGASDHFPVYARFTTAPFERTSPPSSGDDAPDFEPPLNLQDYPGTLSLPDGAFLNALSDAELAPYVAHFYTVEATVLSIRPLRLKVGDRVWPAYYADRSLIETGGLPDYLDSGKVRLVVQPNFYRGESQLVVEDIEGRAP